MCGNVNIFIAGIEDAERYENKATMHKVDLKELIAKLKKLHGANINAIYERINDYWENYEKIDIENGQILIEKAGYFPCLFHYPIIIMKSCLIPMYSLYFSGLST